MFLKRELNLLPLQMREMERGRTHRWWLEELVLTLRFPTWAGWSGVAWQALFVTACVLEGCGMLEGCKELEGGSVLVNEERGCSYFLFF